MLGDLLDEVEVWPGHMVGNDNCGLTQRQFLALRNNYASTVRAAEETPDPRPLAVGDGRRGVVHEGRKERSEE